MKFAIGYQMYEDEEQSFASIVQKYSKHIEEVYFPWLDIPSGRSSLTNRHGYVDWTGQEKLVADIRMFKQMGIKLDLLFNGNCYGSNAMSQYLANNVCSVIEYLGQAAGGVEIVTTTSPAIAHIIKKEFPYIEIRASINMRIGSIKGMQYISHLFDAFYLQREYNRDFDKIEELLFWTKENGKRLLMLANSGCMSFCSAQTFHDNMVAHGNEVDGTQNILDWTPHMCWKYYKDRENWESVLQNTWIRPEDLHNYDPYFPIVKLATRMHSLPGMVIQAYIRRRYYGNLLDLFEPGFGPVFAPYIIDNSRFPENWFDVTSKCNKKCHDCSYCRSVLDETLIIADEA